MRLAADENFHGPILRGLTRRAPAVDLLRVQDTSLLGADDPTLLEWAASEGRVLLTHDSKTLLGHAYKRVAAGLPMPGVILVNRGATVAQAVDDLLLVLACSIEGEYEGRVVFIPLH